MATPQQHDACLPLLAAVQTLQIASPPVVTFALSALAPEFQPSQEWPALPVERSFKVYPKTRMQGRARSLRV